MQPTRTATPTQVPRAGLRARRRSRRDRLYFEVLVVGSGTPADQERVRREMRQLRRPDDPFVYELVFAPSFEDAALATVFNCDIQAVVIYDGFPFKSKLGLPAHGRASSRGT